ncbi:hypothetical protein CCR96_16025 [Halochromatium roseum]|nr:hypothetical protein [Halochromatium roseum]
MGCIAETRGVKERRAAWNLASIATPAVLPQQAAADPGLRAFMTNPNFHQDDDVTKMTRSSA